VYVFKQTISHKALHHKNQQIKTMQIISTTKLNISKPNSLVNMYLINISTTFSLVIIFCFGILNQAVAQKYMLNIDIKNYANDTIIVGHYYGERQLVKDTLIANGKGKFVWNQEEKPLPGMYILVLKPENNFVQFFVNNEDSKISLSLDEKDLSAAKFKGSKENTLFYDYLDYLKGKRILADTLRAKIDRADKLSTVDTASKDLLDQLDKDVKAKQRMLIEEYPTSSLALLIRANNEIEVPKFEGTEEEQKYKRYYYYRSHYWDNIDIPHISLIRSPFMHGKVDFYINKLSSQYPDSLIKTIDTVLTRLLPNPEVYKYYLADFLNKYASMKMVGYDAIYTHLVDKYYSEGKASWVSEETLTKMKENANELRPLLIGKKMPDFTTYEQDGKAVRLYDVRSKYTLVVFWAPDCGHCKKIMPNIVDFYAKNKDKGVKVIGVCTKGGDKVGTCWEGVIEKNMQDFVNTADEYQRYNSQIRIKSTPKLFILDENKEIIIKDFPAEEIDKIFNEIFEMTENQRTAKE